MSLVRKKGASLSKILGRGLQERELSVGRLQSRSVLGGFKTKRKTRNLEDKDSQPYLPGSDFWCSC